MRKASRFRFAIAITILLLAAALWFLLAHEFTFSVEKEPQRRDGDMTAERATADDGLDLTPGPGPVPAPEPIDEGPVERRPGRLEGIVLTADDHPVAGATVTITPLSRPFV